MFRRYLPLILLILAVMIDTAVIPVLGIANLDKYMPPLLISSVIALGLLLGRTRGILWGLVGGLVMDVLASNRFGLFSIVCLVGGYLAGIAGRRYERYMADMSRGRYRHYVLTQVIAPVGCYAIYELVMLVYLYLGGSRLQIEMLRSMLIRTAISAALVQIFYPLYDRLLRPEWSRYASR